MDHIKWLPKGTILAMHARQLAEHGGGTGLRDEGLLESAIQRAQNKFNYENPDISDLAAAYAYGIAKNHPFIDGNKRTALVASRAFLYYNGFQITASNQSKLETFLALASGTLNEEELASWFRNNLRKI
jgi:death on curing protein